MAKSELGTKRLCPNCGAKYYDLNRDPVICPKCGASFMTGLVATRPETARATDNESEEVDDEVEFVPLEEADGGDGEDVDGAVLEDDIDGGAAFIPEEEDDDDGVGDVVRDVDDGEEDVDR